MSICHPVEFPALSLFALIKSCKVLHNVAEQSAHFCREDVTSPAFSWGWFKSIFWVSITVCWHQAQHLLWGLLCCHDSKHISPNVKKNKKWEIRKRTGKGNTACICRSIHRTINCSGRFYVTRCEVWKMLSPSPSVSLNQIQPTWCQNQEKLVQMLSPDLQWKLWCYSAFIHSVVKRCEAEWLHKIYIFSVTCGKETSQKLLTSDFLHNRSVRTCVTRAV